MIIKSKGIVLRSVKYSETSLILDVFTKELGLKTYIISGVRKQKAKVSSGMLQPMNILDLVAYNKESANINRIKEVKMNVIFQTIPFDIRKSSIALFIVELISKSLKEKEPNKGYFDFVENSLIFLDKTKQKVSNFHLVFLVKMSNYLGFYPENNLSETNLYFDLREGKFRHNSPFHNDYLDENQSKSLSLVLRTDLENSDDLSFEKKDKHDLLENLILYYKIHLVDFGKIKTIEIFKKVFESR